MEINLRKLPLELPGTFFGILYLVRLQWKMFPRKRWSIHSGVQCVTGKRFKRFYCLLYEGKWYVYAPCLHQWATGLVKKTRLRADANDQYSRSSVNLSKWKTNYLVQMKLKLHSVRTCKQGKKCKHLLSALTLIIVHFLGLTMQP